ncbi:MAG: Uridine phosphorylase [Tenericutes bacterium ADurb.Bin239]|jgi:uridine phosphorylase|nr:MAG: Uridine phosphorylase [Tenericutes bacterium ADurb.Bin239]
MKPTIYMKGTDKTIAPNVIFSGDPWRVEVLKEYLDNPKKVAFAREYNTYTGTYKGIPVTITSTGIGAPSAAIAMEEMYNCGMKVALRMGTVMSLKDELLGHYIVPVASVRRESTSETYIEVNYPAVANFDFVNIISKTVRDFGKIVDNGLNMTLDGYYSQMKESKLAKERGTDVFKVFAEAKKMGVAGLDMESSCMLVLGRLMNVKTAILTLVTVLENYKDSIDGDVRVKAEDELCRIALESIYRLNKGEK